MLLPTDIATGQSTNEDIKNQTLQQFYKGLTIKHCHATHD